MHRVETLAIHSIEQFLTPAQCDYVLNMVDAQKRKLSRAAISAGTRGQSVHGIEGYGVDQTVAIYEPEGRIEIVGAPQEVSDLLAASFQHRIEDIQRTYPSARVLDDEWIYLEYEARQFVTPHIDYSTNELRPEQPKVAAIGVQLTDGFEGGEFFVETTGSPLLWESSDGDMEIVRGADGSSRWFREMERTRWTCKPLKGTAICWGSQLVHGTRPVKAGVVKKIINFIVG